MRAKARRDLVELRAPAHWKTSWRSAAPRRARLTRARDVLDPNVLTLGFARRFTEYKRPNLLLRDPERLARLLTDPTRPVQIIVAGKAHPHDEIGKDFVAQWAAFVPPAPTCAARAVFLEDYDMALAAQLVQGVDVWINTPRRAWEACGTSGMKVLVNGGLNLSETGRLVGRGVLAAGRLGASTAATSIGGPQDDAAEAEQLYTTARTARSCPSSIGAIRVRPAAAVDRVACAPA